MKKIILFCLCIISFFSACKQSEESIDIDQNQIYTIYELEYDQSNDETVAKAYFKKGNAEGSTLALSGQSNVKCNGEEMLTKIDLNGTFYKARFDGFVKSGKFVWRNIAGREYTNAVYIENSIDFSPDFDTLSRNENYDFFWEGEPLSTDEQAELVFLGSKIDDVRRFMQSQPGAGYILLEEKLLKNFSIGETKAWLERKLTLPLEESTLAGGIRLGIYKTKEVKFEIY